MDTRTFHRVFAYILFNSLIALLLSHSTLSAPVNSTMSYDAFLKNITEENCAFPEGIVLPFKEQATTLEYFSVPLKICKAPDALRRSLEAIRLCNEIYEALRNITCHSDKNVQLPEIKVEFSDNVCQDINSLKIQHGLLKYLTDKFVCEMMCEDDFLPACQVLLWSYQLQKRIEGIPLVQSIQNTPDQGKESTNVGNETPSGMNKMLTKPNKEDPAIDKEQELLPPNPEVPSVENPDSDNKIDDVQHTADDDTIKNELDQTKIDEENMKENEIPEEPIVEGKKDDSVDEKQDQTLKLDKQSKIQAGDEVVDDKKEAAGAKVKEPTPVVNNFSSKENKIDVDEGSPKNSKLSDSEMTVFKNKPATPIKEKTKEIGNKTQPKKDTINVQSDLPSETQKENAVNLKPIVITSTPNNLKPVIPGNNLNKIPEQVSPTPTLPKMPPVDVKEAKVSIKPEVTSPKGNEIADTKVIPTVGKEDAVSVTTVADLEKMEDGIPEPGDKEPDLYNDLGSDGDYPKQYDEDGVYDTSKNKKPEESDSGKISKPALVENESPKYDVFPQRNSFGRDEIPVPFPDQEDSHFFFYFLSLVLILMAGYLLFHNKQKIIALIVEGRHERRRRSHGAAYKKLETK